jgi:hypothetical protein
MYQIVGVAKLSNTQKSRLRNGHPVRIKKGTANKLHLTPEQIKKLESASRRGAAYTVTLNPEQAAQHGSGFFGDIATKLKNLAVKNKDIINPVIKAIKNAGHQGLKKASTAVHNKINEIPEISGGAAKKRRGRPKKRGDGLLGDVLGMVNPTVGAIAKTIGLGVKKRKPRAKKGKGMMSNLAKAGLKAVAPILIDSASSAIKDKISGMGAKKRRGRPRKSGSSVLTEHKKIFERKTKKGGGTKKRKAGRPRKTKNGAALFPAGGALRPAGY